MALFLQNLNTGLARHEIDDMTTTPSPPFTRLRPEAPLGLRAAACLALRAPVVGCRSCVAACPGGRLSLGVGGPALAEGCDGCGRCAATCPTDALRTPGFAVTVPAPAATVELDCWRVPATASSRHGLRVPCLGGLGAARLLEICAEAGGRPVRLLDRGFCDDCPNGGGATHPATAALEETRRLLAAVDVPAAQHPQLAPAPLAATERLAEPQGYGIEQRLDRRGFLGALSARSLAAADQIRPLGLAPADTPPAALRERTLPEERARLITALRRLAPGAALPAGLFPALHASEACTDQRICAAACPTGALFGYERDDERGIAFLAAACVACGACARLCPEQALTLAPGEADARPEQVRVLTRFSRRDCPECGSEFAGEGDACPACRRNHEFVQSAFGALFGSRSL